MSNYSNETLGEILSRIEKNLDERHTQNEIKLNEIILQARTTNGRVRALEVWRGFITGGLVIISLLIGFILNYI